MKALVQETDLENETNDVFSYNCVISFQIQSLISDACSYLTLFRRR